LKLPSFLLDLVTKRPVLAGTIRAIGVTSFCTTAMIALDAVAADAVSNNVASNKVAPNQTPSNQADPSAKSYSLDWVPYSDLTVKEKEQVPSFCAGMYRPQSNISSKDGSTQVTADTADYLEDGSISLIGNVQIVSKDMTLQAEEAFVSADRSEVKAYRYVTIRQNGVVVHGDEGTFNLKRDQFNITNPVYAMPVDGMRGAATHIEQGDSGDIVIAGGSYTSCAPSDNSWQLVGSNIDLDQDSGFGTAIHARLELADIPVFYWPYLKFPIDDRRHTGLLMPSLSVGQDGIDEYEQPLYLNIAPNADATLSPHWYKSRGVLLNSEFRWLVAENHYVEVASSYFDNDPEFDDDRQLSQLVMKGQITGQWRYNVDYSEASDDYFLTDFETGFTAANISELLQTAEIEGRYDHWQLIGRLQGYQQLDPDLADGDKVYYKLPELQANGRWQTGGLAYGVKTQLVEFRRDITTPIAGSVYDGTIDWGNTVEAQRYHLEPYVEYREDALWGYWQLKGRLQHTGYKLDGQPDGVDEQPQRLTPVVSADGGLYFDRDTRFFDQPYTQTLEPRLFFAASPTEEQVDNPIFDTDEYAFDVNQLYRDTRFSGVDRAGDLIKTTLGVTSRFIQNSSGREQLVLNAGQSFYAKDRTVSTSSDGNETLSYDQTRDASPLVVEAIWQPTERITARVSRQWDYNNDRIEREEEQLTVEFANGASAMLRHYRSLSNCTLLNNCTTDDEVSSDVADLGLFYPINDQWRTFYAHKQDLKNDTQLERIAGVEYESCCWLVRFARHQWQTSSTTATSDDSIGVQLVLKGFGGIGQKGSFARTEDYIPSYTPISK